MPYFPISRKEKWWVENTLYMQYALQEAQVFYFRSTFGNTLPGWNNYCRNKKYPQLGRIMFVCIRSDGHTTASHSLNSPKLILPCPIVALNKATGNVSLDCTCFLLPCIFIKNPDAAAVAPLFHNVSRDCKGKHMWPTSFNQIK